jgi:hypothetical protein
MLRIDRMPLGLMIRPAARIVRELPPSLTAYRVAVSFRAAPLAAPTSCGVRSAKAKTPQFVLVDLGSWREQQQGD